MSRGGSIESQRDYVTGQSSSQQQPSTSSTADQRDSDQPPSAPSSSSATTTTIRSQQQRVPQEGVPSHQQQQQAKVPTAGTVPTAAAASMSQARASLSYLAIADSTSPAFSGGSPTSTSGQHQHFDMLASFTSNPIPSHPMKYRNLGKSGLKVPTIALAVWSTFGTKLNDQGAEEIVTAAYEAGINYFDTGDGFLNGRSESILGSILRRKSWRRNTYIVSTKLFWTSGPSVSNNLNPSLSRKFMIEALENSLKRLQLKYVDIVIINKLDGMCPMEEIVRTMAHIMDKGLAFYWGTCRWSPVHIMEAFTIARQFNLTPPSVEQMEYHMFTRDKMELYMPELYHKLGVGVISWSPTSLNYDDGISLISRRAAIATTGLESTLNATGSTDSRAVRTAKQLQLVPLTTKLGCDYNQLNTAWSLRNENTNCVLIAPRTIDQLHSQLNSLKVLPKLNVSLMEEMDKILENKPALRRQQSSSQSNVHSPPMSGSTSNIAATTGAAGASGGQGGGPVSTTVTSTEHPEHAATSV